MEAQQTADAAAAAEQAEFQARKLLNLEGALAAAQTRAETLARELTALQSSSKSSASMEALEARDARIAALQSRLSSLQAAYEDCQRRAELDVGLLDSRLRDTEAAAAADVALIRTSAATEVNKLSTMLKEQQLAAERASTEAAATIAALQHTIAECTTSAEARIAAAVIDGSRSTEAAVHTLRTEHAATVSMLQLEVESARARAAELEQAQQQYVVRDTHWSEQLRQAQAKLAMEADARLAAESAQQAAQYTIQQQARQIESLQAQLAAAAASSLSRDSLRGGTLDESVDRVRSVNWHACVVCVWSCICVCEHTHVYMCMYDFSNGTAAGLCCCQGRQQCRHLAATECIRNSILTLVSAPVIMGFLFVTVHSFLR